MHPACLLVAGALRATLPAGDFTLTWSHSVEHIQWIERYRTGRDRIRLVRARVEGSGAGMEAGDGAKFDGSGWTWTPTIAPLDEVRLTLSPYTTDYQLCAAGRCRTLHDWVGAADDVTTVVTIQACSRPHAKGWASRPEH